MKNKPHRFSIKLKEYPRSWTKEQYKRFDTYLRKVRRVIEEELDNE